MEALKGLILSGGAGTRLRPLTHTSAKQLIPVANRPVLFYGIDAMVEAGITEIGIVIAPETGDEIREAVGDGSAFGASVTWIVQDRPAGLAHAVLTARDFIGSSPFVTYLGDNLLKNGISGLVDSFREGESDAMVLLTPVPDPSSYGVAEVEEDRIVNLIEKPEDPPSDLALVGVYMFTPSIFEMAEGLEPSARGELEITEAIQALIDRDMTVDYEIVEGWWKDTGMLDDILEANRLVLEEVEAELSGTVENSEVEGSVVLAEGAVIRDSTVTGPAVIGAGSLIENSRIGPNTALGEVVVVRGSSIENSIVLSGSRIEEVAATIEASLLGRNVRVGRRQGSSEAIHLMVGDNSAIEVT
jgi:glucose-1-phosphate thymidylyltransferase